MSEKNKMDLARRFYRQLYRIRMVEEEIARIYPSDKIKSPVHLSIGQEAVSVAVCEAMRKDDVAVGTYRGHAMYLAKGGDLNKMIAELYGKATGCARGKGGSMHLIDTSSNVVGTSAIVGTGIPIAVGYAYAHRCRGSDAVVACFFGDGAVDEGAYHESVNFAVLRKLPVLFVCENNQYAIHSHHLSRRPEDNLCDRAASYGMKVRRFEDSDTFSIYEHAKNFFEQMRFGGGPAFMECMTYRWKEHVGPGDDWSLGYRDETEAADWIEKDQLKLVKSTLPEDVRNRIEAEVEKEIREAFDFAERSEFPEYEELNRHIFKE